MAGFAASATHARSAGAADAAGLVPSKTSGVDVLLPIGAEVSRQRRIARMRRGVWGAGQWLGRLRGMRCWFVTLTYRPGVEWQPAHVSRAIKALREWCGKRGCRPVYVWVAELQKRGAVHYHVAVWLPKGLALPKFDKAGWWPHGMTQRQVAVAPIGYLMKYVSKGDNPFAQFPKGARIYGVGGLCTEGRAIRQWLNLPEWAKQLHGVGELRRAACGLVVRESGEILVSPWRVDRVPGALRLRLTGDLPARWADGPYSTLQ